MSETAKKRSDKTSSKRATSHLAKLNAGGGKRVPVDLDADRLRSIELLIEAGVAPSSAGVIRVAIDELFASLIKDST